MGCGSCSPVYSGTETGASLWTSHSRAYKTVVAESTHFFGKHAHAQNDIVYTRQSHKPCPLHVRANVDKKTTRRTHVHKKHRL